MGLFGGTVLDTDQPMSATHGYIPHNHNLARGAILHQQIHHPIEHQVIQVQSALQKIKDPVA